MRLRKVHQTQKQAKKNFLMLKTIREEKVRQEKFNKKICERKT